MKKFVFVWLVVFAFASFMVGEVLPATVTMGGQTYTYQSISIDPSGNITITTTATPPPSGNSITGQVYVKYTGGLGTISVGIPNATMTLSGSGTGTKTTDANGYYTFSGLPDGSYTVTPSKTNYSFNPSSSTNAVASNQTATANFEGTPSSVYTISGNVKDKNNANFPGVTMQFYAGATLLDNQDVTDSSGNYSISPVADGITYTITPVLSVHTFSPASLNVTVTGGSVTGQNFVEQNVGTGTYSQQVATAVKLNQSSGGLNSYGYYQPNKYTIPRGGTVYFLVDPVGFGIQVNSKLINFIVEDYTQGQNGIITATLMMLDSSNNLWKGHPPFTLSGINQNFSVTDYYYESGKKYLIMIQEAGVRDTPISIWWSVN